MSVMKPEEEKSPIVNSPLTKEEYDELYSYIMKNHSWKNMYELSHDGKNPKFIKYMSNKVDTRDGSVWSISFYSIINNDTNKENDEVTFRDGCNYNMKDEIYKWLKGERNEKI